MEKQGWKITAIIFITLFVGTWAMAIWGITILAEEEKLNAECLYEICDDYAQGYWNGEGCFCYDYNIETESWEVALQVPHP